MQVGTEDEKSPSGDCQEGAVPKEQPCVSSAASEKSDHQARHIDVDIDVAWTNVSVWSPNARHEDAVELGKTFLLSGVSGHAKGGQVLCILGPSGSGKTTLLSWLAGRRFGSSSAASDLNTAAAVAMSSEQLHCEGQHYRNGLHVTDWKAGV